MSAMVVSALTMVAAVSHPGLMQTKTSQNNFFFKSASDDGKLPEPRQFLALKEVQFLYYQARIYKPQQCAQSLLQKNDISTISYERFFSGKMDVDVTEDK